MNKAEIAEGVYMTLYEQVYLATDEPENPQERFITASDVSKAHEWEDGNITHVHGKGYFNGTHKEFRKAWLDLVDANNSPSS